MKICIKLLQNLLYFSHGVAELRCVSRSFVGGMVPEHRQLKAGASRASASGTSRYLGLQETTTLLIKAQVS